MIAARGTSDHAAIYAQYLFGVRLGLTVGLATPSEFRTEPLMGVHLEKHFLHDGAATTIEQAIELHAGEATRSRPDQQAIPAR